ncbi:MAG: NAD(P)-binding domain-containing protein [Deltaproteobacteria bacterium]|nr:NAD(P)-binding domain-containing protein [Deltaproteobacteria bacterium]
MVQIGVIGAGQMGSQIGKVASEDHDVVYYDIDNSKACSAAAESHCRYEEEINGVLESQIIFLAVPKEGVVNLLRRYHTIVSRGTLWVNISTFITLKEIREITEDTSNIVSCKIIGHFERMSPAHRCAFVIHREVPENPLVGIVEEVFRRVGTTIYDDENRYLEVNYIAATEAMKGVLATAKKLKDLNFPTPIIEAAVQQVFVGTAGQFPYRNPDYFHDLVYGRNPGLKELNQEILKFFR